MRGVWSIGAAAQCERLATMKVALSRRIRFLRPPDALAQHAAAAPLAPCRGTTHPAVCLAYHSVLKVGSVGPREHASRSPRPPRSTKTWFSSSQHLDTRESTASGTMSLNLEKQLRFVRRAGGTQIRRVQTH